MGVTRVVGLMRGELAELPVRALMVKGNDVSQQ